FFQNTENMKLFRENNISIKSHKLLPGSGVNLNYFHPLDYPSDETVEFVFISRIMKEKGIDQYLEAARYIKNKYKNTKFHICGFLEGDYKEIISKAESENIIEYHGMVDDVRKILSRTHCTIH